MDSLEATNMKVEDRRDLEAEFNGKEHLTELLRT